MKNFTLGFLLLAFVIPCTQNGFAQLAGDFSPNVSGGNWSNPSIWDVYDGSVWGAASSVPTPTTNIYVRLGYTVSVDNASPVCKDLNIDNSLGSKVAFGSASSILNVNGNFTLTNTANCFGIWTFGAKIVFTGSAAQTLPDNLATFSVLDNIEVNKSN